MRETIIGSNYSIKKDRKIQDIIDSIKKEFKINNNSFVIDKQQALKLVLEILYTSIRDFSS
ncbi:hypothetical protein [Cetobacterium sp.]|uniref:hypothetical protein n=1 Tax=Cetobacterium sp. TaxID=2071632 RepID=UPI003F661F72